MGGRGERENEYFVNMSREHLSEGTNHEQLIELIRTDMTGAARRGREGVEKACFGMRSRAQRVCGLEANI